MICTGPSAQSLAGWTLESEALRRDMGTWLLACICICTCVCLGVSVTGEGQGPRSRTFTCLTNNILRIDCHWSAPELGQGSSPWLLFTSNQAPGGTHKCILRGSECTVVLPPEAVLVPSDNFTITFHHCMSGREQVSLVDPEYLPRRHVKLDPPSDLQSNISSGHCILTWSISPALEPMTTLLSYELAFKKQEEAWEQAQHRDHIVGVTWLILEAFELDPGFIHEARLRVQMATLEDDVVEEERYTGQWSEWSQPVCFQAPQRQGPLIPPWGWPGNTLVAVSIFLLLTGPTYLLFKLSPRVKRIFYQNVPSPAMFFQPLYSVHNGNFQTWMGAHGAGVLLSQDCAGTPQGALEPCVQEATALLTCGPARPWKSVALEEEQEGPGTRLPGNLSSEDVLPAGCTEWRVQTLAYLPQEDWAPTSLTRPAPPDSEGSRSSSSSSSSNNNNYCALGCYGGWHLSALPGNTQSSGPIPALACGLSCDHQGLETQQGVAWVLAGHCQRPGLHEDLQGMLLPSVLSKARSWTF
ncbi:interleukin-9 receptor isoform X4 [Homo sapiens]|uniref:interleukin-9 receptor isoform X4 n=1 Tax=Homo sapiens TaxID=9606 RepID=UPI0003EB0169|nr:interleukin-9 receptor isoform X4 [Homo sapiens]XP_047298688.1 interleukin-9 receptor isoform X4 [Homo sapiens]XP_054182999.1 interleukin-9 receptor isoform X4 [Homo sapiens]XP_054184265.1 interleukin-9 receptor isoform X4 [Homo sapiens]